LIWFIATMPSTIPAIEPSQQRNPTSEATSDAMASEFVFWAGGP
jgi:hypothetical protein